MEACINRISNLFLGNDICATCLRQNAPFSLNVLTQDLPFVFPPPNHLTSLLKELDDNYDRFDMQTDRQTDRQKICEVVLSFLKTF